MKSNSWLVSSAGRRGELVTILKSIAQESAGAKVAAIDMSPLSAGGLLADVFRLVPSASSPDFIPRVLEVCHDQDIRVVIPTIDPELAVYAAEREQFERDGIKVWVSTPEVVAVASDKWQTHMWALRNGLPTIHTVEAKRLHVESSSFEGPVVAKPRSGSASKGVYFFESVHAAMRAELPEEYIVQERLDGQEVTIDFAVAEDGTYLGAVPRLRLEARAGEVTKALTFKDDDMLSLARRVAAALPGAYGLLNVQVFRDRTTGELAILEVNPRFGGGFPLSHYAGAEFIRGLLAEMDGQPLPSISFEDQLVMLRYDTQVVMPFGDLPR